MALIQVPTTGKARDQKLATCARNIWLIAALNNIQFQFSHIPGKQNILADLLSRWHMVHSATEKLNSLISNYVWLPTHLTLTSINHTIHHCSLCCRSQGFSSPAGHLGIFMAAPRLQACHN